MAKLDAETRRKIKELRRRISINGQWANYSGPEVRYRVGQSLLMIPVGKVDGLIDEIFGKDA